MLIYPIEAQTKKKQVCQAMLTLGLLIRVELTL